MIDAPKELIQSIESWKKSPHSSYNRWFLWERRLKYFRSIRRATLEFVKDVKTGGFGNSYKDSTLETLMTTISEQRQIFKGADHALVWKPKLRIPDIYENSDNKLRFAYFLENFMNISDYSKIDSLILEFSKHQIKGLGPAIANILYFIHPTGVIPFNTAIVNGFNKITGQKIRLGKFDDYLKLKNISLELNQSLKNHFSNDLGAIAGFFFDLAQDPNFQVGTSLDSLAIAKAAQKNKNALAKIELEGKEEHSHIEIQHCLKEMGQKLGFHVWIASNDKKRIIQGEELGCRCLEKLPEFCLRSTASDTIRFIDVLWFDSNLKHVVAAFEVEHSTSIYSGILRLLDLSLSVDDHELKQLYIVSSDLRENEVLEQGRRPAFQAIKSKGIKFIPYSQLFSHKDSIIRFGEGLKAIDAIANKI